jgi:methionyl-tRNA formyltransferase
MKICFIGGVKFSFELLKTILDNKFNVEIVFSYNHDKNYLYSDITSFDEICKNNNILHIKVDNINDQKNFEILKKIKPDIILVMGWSQIIKKPILNIPKYGVIGSHPTELPKYRGRAPIPWTIIKNLKTSALTFFFMDEGIDDGDILDQEIFLINKNDDSTSIYNKIIKLGKKMIIKNLKLIENGTEKRTVQDVSKFLEYWERRKPDDGLIDWNENAETIDRLIRASTAPYPGSFTFFKNLKLIIWKSEYEENKKNRPGEILQINDNDVRVGTKKGSILIKKISFDNKIVPLTKIFHQQDLGTILGK